ncbi:MAG: M13 family metallopeptidase, partial [Proteobacteria bacterium]|nr:M13 family metallopeptidase [Pseudomonadota bacterium]
GILQPPFFDPAADPAYNYGAIGAVIGHEISHSFDNNGADFDAQGALRHWWTPADLAAFRRQGEALAAQHSAYEPLPGLHVNGPLTLGENLADLAGLQAALDAYHASLNGRPAPVIDGLTGDQRFFIAYAQTWATKMREAALRQRIATDGHAPGMYRALTVRNIDAWYQTFNVQPSETLYLTPEHRVRVWYGSRARRRRARRHRCAVCLIPCQPPRSRRAGRDRRSPPPPRRRGAGWQ